jgi:hypothetical protein
MPRSRQWVAKARTYPAEVQAVADKLAPKVRKQFLDAWAKAAKQVGEAQLAAAIAAKDLGKVAKLFDVGGLDKAFKSMIETLTQGFGAAGETSFDRLASDGPLVGAFDLSNPRAAKWARANGAKLVKGLEQSAKGVIKELVAKGTENGTTVAQTARLLRGSIGLTERQAKAVTNYRAELIAKGKTPDAASKTAGNYATQLLNKRAKTIAVTETQTAVHRGQREAWEQAADKGLIDRDKTSRTWVCDPDACDECEPYDDTSVDFSDEFDDGDPPLHPMCRCNIRLEFD